MNKQADSDARHEAICDCKYAKSLGEAALMQHITIWRDSLKPYGSTDADLIHFEYWKTIFEISEKLGTPECLLEN